MAVDVPQYVGILGGREIDDNGQMKVLLAGKGVLLAEMAGLDICGRNDGDPSSIERCHQLGMNPVSCSLLLRAHRSIGRTCCH